MTPTPRFFITKSDFGLQTNIDFVIPNADGSHSVALPITMQHVPETKLNPTVHMLEIHHRHSQDALQSLMDGLWSIGIRPTDIGTAGHLAATQAHLNDFRAIIAKTLDVQLPQKS